MEKRYEIVTLTDSGFVDKSKVIAEVYQDDDEIYVEKPSEEKGEGTYYCTLGEALEDIIEELFYKDEPEKGITLVPWF